MYQLVATTRFKKDLKKVRKNFGDFNMVRSVLKILQLQGFEGILIQMKPHKLKGKYKDNWECHIKPDLLIIWIQVEKPKTIKLVRLGSHSDLFQ
ncbi:MAG: type II toxin-antitoxin system mRNA interferase toxin, RelE/StbE family [Flavobacteriaceae bacterium]|nr:MAG: type II toxin-antitoxin system mRNA interferase toxin, RelE/StbE family [Flavobacteriaceae bacterium]